MRRHGSELLRMGKALRVAAGFGGAMAMQSLALHRVVSYGKGKVK